MNSNDILISVIIPTFKRSEFLPIAIDSVLAQTYKNIEVIVVSDNDIDNEYDKETCKVMKRYATCDNVKYLPAIGNHGGCYARNRGLNSAKGAYVNFLDDDDSFYPTKIERQVEAIRKHPGVAVVSCYGAIVNAEGNIYRYEKTSFDSENILYSELLCNLGTTTLNLINTEICRKAGGFKYIESSQEHLFLLGIFEQSPTFVQVKEVLARIYQHNGERVSNNNKRAIGTLKMTKIIEGYYPQLTEAQKKKVQLARYKVDILAYKELNEKKKAWALLAERCKLKLIDIENIKITIKMLMR